MKEPWEGQEDVWAPGHGSGLTEEELVPQWVKVQTTMSREALVAVGFAMMVGWTLGWLVWTAVVALL